MKSEVKKIDFNHKLGGNYYFDLVELEDILKSKPKGHSQFEHHKISFYVLVIITESIGKHSINYIDYTYKKGTVFTLRKNSVHKFYPSKAKGKFIVFTDDFLIRFADKTKALKLFQLFNEMLSSPKLQINNNEFADIQNLLDEISREFFSVKDNHSIEIIKSLVQILLHKLFRIKSRDIGNLVEHKYQLQFIALQELIEENCFNSKKVSFYADKLNVTSRTLNNITQSIIGKNVKAFIDEILILQIKRLLINSGLTFTEIAYESGFEDPSNFFKYFRKMTGITPKEFKEQCE